MDYELKKKDGSVFTDPFAIRAALEKAIEGEFKAESRNGGRVYLLTVEGCAQEKLLSVARLNSEEVSITKVVRGARRCVRAEELREMTEESILEKLRPQGVIGVRRINGGAKGARARKPTALLVLTFSGTPPNKINIGMVTKSLQPYRVTPVRCSNCLVRGHLAKGCHGAAKCPRCTGKCRPDQCNKKPFCIDCNKAGHPSGDKSCPVEIEETRILALAEERGISRKDMKKLLRTEQNPSPKPGTSSQPLVVATKLAAGKPAAKKKRRTTSSNQDGSDSEPAARPAKTPRPARKSKVDEPLVATPKKTPAKRRSGSAQPRPGQAVPTTGTETKALTPPKRRSSSVKSKTGQGSGVTELDDDSDRDQKESSSSNKRATAHSLVSSDEEDGPSGSEGTEPKKGEDSVAGSVEGQPDATDSSSDDENEKEPDSD